MRPNAGFLQPGQAADIAVTLVRGRVDPSHMPDRFVVLSLPAALAGSGSANGSIVRLLTWSAGARGAPGVCLTPAPLFFGFPARPPRL